MSAASDQEPPGAGRRGRGAALALRIGLALLAVTVGLALLAAAALVVADTPFGHRLIAQAVGRAAPANGARVRLGGIEGSLWGRLVLRDLAVSDPQGVFLTSPAVAVDWSPGALLGKHVLIRSLSADTLTVLRRPALKPGPPPKPGEPTIPDIHLTVGDLRVGALVLEPALAGQRRVLTVRGSTLLLAREAKLNLAIDTVASGGAGGRRAGGDRLTVMLDAAPSRNRLALDVHLLAPKGGAVDGLAKLGAPLALDLNGRGDWAKWDGRLTSTLGGGPLVGADLSARDGLFAVRGEARLRGLVKGPAEALAEPAVAFDLSGTMRQRRLDGRLRLASAALRLDGRGRLDLAASRFEGVTVDAALLKPEAASPKLTGEGMTLALVLDGPFAQPVIAYDLRARRLGFGDTVIEELRAAAKAEVDAERTLKLPVHATARRITGLNEAVGGLVTNIRIDGDVLVSARQIASDNLRLRTDRLDAGLVLALSLDTGRYDAALKGRINRYAVKGVGLVDLVTDARLVPTGRGQFRIAGHVHGQTLRLDNPSLQTFLGGNAVVDADFSRSPSGDFGLARLRLTAPKFAVTNGQGVYRANGSLSLALDARSEAYGPVRLEVSGTAADPRARLRAPDPRIGGLKAVDLQVQGAGKDAYSLRMTAASPYGPVQADIGLRLGGLLEAQVRQVNVGGLRAFGRLTQTRDGPFAGALTLEGWGLDGRVRLSAAGKAQKADAQVRARNARIPLAKPVTIASGTIGATAILYPKAPEVTANAVLAGVRQADLAVANAKVDFAYRNGSGRATLSADGERGVPFKLAAEAGIAPQQITVAGQGAINRVDIRLASPAVVVKETGGWRLQPTTVLLPQGRIDLSGASGKTTSARVQIDNLDLSIAQAFAPELGLSGQLSGALAVDMPAGGAMPTGRMDLKIARFTRTGLTTVSEPVDASLQATLDGRGAQAYGLIRRQGAVIGRLQAKVAPRAGAQPWMDRLKTGQLSGGVRYNGGAETLWALSGVSGQALSGPIAIGADVSGTVDRPRVNGVVRAKGLRYENAAFGTVIDQIAIDGRFVESRFELSSLTARAGSGALSANGFAELSSANGFPIDLKMRFDKAQLARSDNVNVAISGQLAATNSRDKGALVSGDLTLDQTRYEIVRQGAAEVVDLQGVRRKGQPVAEVTPTTAAAPAAGPPSVWKLDIRIRAPERLFVSGMGLEAEWRADLRITGDARHPVVVGDINLVRGTFVFAGKELNLNRGVIHLDGSQPPNPVLDIQASTTIDEITATVDIAGTATTPDITFGSTPALPQDEVLARLLFGSSITQLSPLQAVQLAAALNSLRGGGGGLDPIGKLRSVAGLDRLRFSGADKTSGRGPSVGAGKYIAKNIYLEITTDTRGFTATQIEIGLTRTLRLLSQVGAFGGSNLSLRYSRDY